jgi:hypothetical protein
VRLREGGSPPFDETGGNLIKNLKRKNKHIYSKSLNNKIKKSEEEEIWKELFAVCAGQAHGKAFLPCHFP